MRLENARIENSIKKTVSTCAYLAYTPITHAGEDVAKVCRWIGFVTLTPSIE